MYILIYDETVSNVILCQLKHGLDYFFLHSVELIFKLRTVTNIYPSFSLLFQLNSFPFDITKYEPISNRKILFERKNLQKGLLSSTGYMHCIINLKLTIIIVKV